MWESRLELRDGGRIRKVSITRAGEQLCYREVLDLWHESESFRLFFMSLLADAPFSAYLWETPPVTEALIERPFELVLVESGALASARADPGAFAGHFRAADPDQATVTFPNLGRDAVLVAPCPRGPDHAYTHLAAFSRQAPAAQQHALWQAVADAMKQQVGRRPIWLSTSGLGVFWLHVRLDTVPKYYAFGPYRQLG